MIFRRIKTHVAKEDWFAVAPPPIFRLPPRRRGPIWNVLASEVFYPSNLGVILRYKMDAPRQRDERVEGVT